VARHPARHVTRPRILLVDDDELILESIGIFLDIGLPRASVVKYHTPVRGRPRDDFDWSGYDVLLIDYNLGGEDTALRWLDDYGWLPGFPATVLLLACDDPATRNEARGRGVGVCLNKTRLDPDELVQAVNHVIDTRHACGAEPRDLLLSGSSRPAVASTRGPDGAHGHPGKAHPGREPLASRTEPRIPHDPAAPALARRVYTHEVALEHGYLDAGSGRGRYRLVRLIGRGTMARAYLAERDGDRQTAVVKILDRDAADDRESFQRFSRQGELLAGIDSPYVATLFDHGDSNGLSFIAMEFFGRGDLAQRMSRGVSPREAVLYLHDIACGLEEAHRRGVVHRDLKPGSIMFRSDGSSALADFGIAKPMDSDTSLTANGVIPGAPHGMSPEQTEGRDADARSDLYAAGVLYYEMLTGERPFFGPTLRTLALAIRTEPVPRLGSSLAPHQPVLDRLLAKDPEDRFQSAGELIDVLRSLPDAP
jgi:DNA-binding NarL/FixJ family response regulator